MKKGINLIIILVLLWTLFLTGPARAVNEEKAAYLIVFQNFCIIVKSPAKQFTSSVGRSDLGIILKDKTTHIFINGNYLAIAVPLNKIGTAISKYHLQNFTFIE